MLPASKNILVYKGDTYEMFFRLKRKIAINNTQYIDLTGATVAAQIRTTEASSTVLAEFDCVVEDQEDPDTVGGVTISLPAAETTTLTDGKYDVQVTYPDGKVKTYLKGDVKVTQEVTRA
jgi:hypothetical protein